MLVEDDEQLIDHVVGYYDELFKEIHKWWPRLDGFKFASISREDNYSLRVRLVRLRFGKL